MLDLLRDVLKSDVGSFSFIFGLLVLCFWGVRKITIITFNHDVLTKNTEKTERHIDEMRKDLSYLRGNIDIALQGRGHQLTKAHSPISLTPEGEKVASELGAAEMIDRNWSEIQKYLDKKIRYKNPYDIQQECMYLVAVEPDNFFTHSDLAKIKQYAYNNGKFYRYYSDMFAIIIRDRYLKENHF